jgi:de-etiolated-1
MWKMQLLDEEHILIRYASEEVATIKIQEPNTQASFFMVYNMATTTVNILFD